MDPEREIGRRAESPAGGEGGVENAEFLGHVDAPREEDVSDDAKRRYAVFSCDLFFD